MGAVRGGKLVGRAESALAIADSSSSGGRDRPRLVTSDEDRSRQRRSSVGAAGGPSVWTSRDVHSFEGFPRRPSNRSWVPSTCWSTMRGIIAVGQAIDEPDAVTKRILAVQRVRPPFLGSKLAAGRMASSGAWGHVHQHRPRRAGLMPVPGIADVLRPPSTPSSDSPKRSDWRTEVPGSRSLRSCRRSPRLR